MRLPVPPLLATLAVGAAVLLAPPAGAVDTPSVNVFAIPSAGPGTLAFFAVSGITPGEVVTPRLVDATDPSVSFAMAPLTAASGGGVVPPTGYRAPADVVPGTYRLEVDPATGPPAVSTTTATIVAPAVTPRSDVAPGTDVRFDLTGLGGDPSIARTVSVDGVAARFSVSEFLSQSGPMTGRTTLTVTMRADLAVGPHTLGFTQAASPAVTLTRPYTAPKPYLSVPATLATQDTVEVDAEHLGPQGGTLSVRDASGRTVALPRLDASGRATAVLPGLAPGDAVFTAVGTANGAVATTTARVLPTTLAVGSSLRDGGSILSPTGRTELEMDWDGSINVSHDGQLTWSSGIHGFFGYSPRLVVQSDGNLVVYGADNRVIWNARSSTKDAPPRLSVLDDGRAVLASAHGTVLWSSPTAATSTRAAGTGLASGAALYAGSYALAMQTDGNLVLRRGATVAFTTSTAANPGATLTLQTDGNLVLRSKAGTALWANRAVVGAGAALILQTDGNLVERAANGRAVWSTGTAGR